MRFVWLLPILAPLALVPPIAAAASSPTVHYVGRGDHRGFAVTLDRHGRTADWELTWHSACDAPNTEEDYALGTSSTPGERPLHMGRRGRFRIHRHFRNPWGTVFDIHFAGRFRRSAVVGTFSETSATPNDASTIHCTSGLVHWTARRGGQ